VSVYWFNILLFGLFLFASWRHARRAGLVSSDTVEQVDSSIRCPIVIAQSLYAVGAALCVFNTYVSIAFIVLVQLNYVIAPRRGPLSRH
jgi:uncharacterized membrane protein